MTTDERVSCVQCRMRLANSITASSTLTWRCQQNVAGALNVKAAHLAVAMVLIVHTSSSQPATSPCQTFSSTQREATGVALPSNGCPQHPSQVKKQNKTRHPPHSSPPDMQRKAKQNRGYRNPMSSSQKKPNPSTSSASSPT